MFDKLKEKIGVYILARQLKRNVKEEINFNSFINSSHKILIIYPEDSADYKFASEIAGYFISLDKIVTVFLPEHKLNVLSIKSKVKSLTYNFNDISRFSLPNAAYKQNLESYATDVVIDLNLGNNLFSSAAANYVKSKFRIGFIKENSDLYYNFQLPNQINNENSYRNLLNSFRMF